MSVQHYTINCHAQKHGMSKQYRTYDIRFTRQLISTFPNFHRLHRENGTRKGNALNRPSARHLASAHSKGTNRTSLHLQEGQSNASNSIYRLESGGTLKGTYVV